MTSLPGFNARHRSLATVALLAAAVFGLSGCPGAGPECDDPTVDCHEQLAAGSMDDSNPSASGSEDSTACGTTPPVPADECEYPPALIHVPPAQRPIHADDPALSAVGILERDKGASWEQFCTGSLIGTKTVLTAYHCVDEKNETIDDVWFRVGSRRIKVATAVRDGRGPIKGGFNDVGSDVAVVVLESDVDGVVPLGFRGLREDEIDVGESLTAVGYFFQKSGATEGGLQVADLALRALEGRHLEDAFETKENFESCSRGLEGLSRANLALAVRRAPNLSDPIAVCGPGGETQDVYHQRLLDGYQAWFHGGLRGAQPCKGDSGGPLVRRTDSGLSVYGVVSGSVNLGGSKDRCAFGAVYAIFPKGTLEWLQDMRDLHL